MYRATSQLIEQYYQDLIIFAVLTAIAFIMLTVLIIISGIMMRKHQYRNRSICLGLGLFFLIAFIWCAVKLNGYIQDYDYVVNKDFKYITGIVLDYASGSSDDNGEVTYGWPIVQDTITGERISLNVRDSVKQNGEYSFVYLPNSKIAQIINY